MTFPPQILRITFPYFHLESSTNCNFDFLQVHDGDSASAYVLGKFCGQNNPPELHSSHNSLYFWFRSDHSVSGGGFTVAWQSQDPGRYGYTGFSAVEWWVLRGVKTRLLRHLSDSLAGCPMTEEQWWRRHCVALLALHLNHHVLCSVWRRTLSCLWQH